MEKLKPLMFVGTGSDVGKSIIATAFCRIFLQDGYTPAPFKAQNMALNSYATADGLEIGRAQAVQAEAAGVACSVEMNPILLKPNTDTQVQVMLHGKLLGNQSAVEYFNRDGRMLLRKEVNDAFDRLKQKYNPIIMEGAGSISEINLRELDLVNMSMAMHADAAVILVADIDKGGIFASVYGSLLLLNEEERILIKGILINKFRGDMRLFHSGIKMLEDLCHIPVVGVIPYYKDIYIEEEDSVMLNTKHTQSQHGKVNIAVILLPHMSNFTDFNVLERHNQVHLYYVHSAEEISKAHIIIIPGSKSTMSDLNFLRNTGIAQSILQARDAGAGVIGICGGYQMMGHGIYDEFGIEGTTPYLPALGILPVVTYLEREKTTRQVSFSFQNLPDVCHGYEIHVGKTEPLEHVAPCALNMLNNGEKDGFFLNETCFGTYIHGILDHTPIINYLITPYVDSLNDAVFDINAFQDQQYNKLADHVRKNVQMDLIYNFVKTPL